MGRTRLGAAGSGGRGRRRRPRGRRWRTSGRAGAFPPGRDVGSRGRGRPPRARGRGHGAAARPAPTRRGRGPGRGPGRRCQHGRDRLAARQLREIRPKIRRERAGRRQAGLPRAVHHGADLDRAVPPRARPGSARTPGRRPSRAPDLRRSLPRTSRAAGPARHRHPRSAPEHHPAQWGALHGRSRPAGVPVEIDGRAAPATDLVTVTVVPAAYRLLV